MSPEKTAVAGKVQVRPATPADAEAIQIDIEEREYRARNMELAAKDRVRELRLWSKFEGELEAAEPFDTKDPNTDQLIGLSKRLVNDIAAGITAGASISAAEAGNLICFLNVPLMPCALLSSTSFVPTQ